MFSLLFINIVDGMRIQNAKDKASFWMIGCFRISKKKRHLEASEPDDFCLGYPGFVTHVVEQEFLLGHCVLLCLFYQTIDS